MIDQCQTSLSQLAYIGLYSIIINVYEKGRLVARGGSSEVYQIRKVKGCTQQNIGEILILKQLTKTKSIQSIQQIVSISLSILNILNGLYSKRFPRCLSYWSNHSSKEHYIVLERCSYGTLRDFIKYLSANELRLTKNQIIYFLHQILKGIEIMHNLKMIHRDIKPENIMIDHDCNIKLIDFSLTKIGQGGKDPYDQSQNGTLEYMAPQMLEKEGNYSYEVDIWSIGVVLQPYKGNTIQKLTQLIKKEAVNYPFAEGYGQVILFTKSLLRIDKQQRPKIQQLLTHSVFQSLNKNKIINKIIQQKYSEYFEFKIKSNYTRKNKLDESFQINFPPQIHDNDCLKIKMEKIAINRSSSNKKVKIIYLLHNKNYGFFILLSNLTLIGYFNNKLKLKLNMSLLKSRTKTNEESILCYIYQKYFRNIINEWECLDTQVNQKQPFCTINNVVIVKNKLFVRLTNNVLQVFIQEKLISNKNNFTFYYQKSVQFNTHCVQFEKVIIADHQNISKLDTQLMNSNQTIYQNINAALLSQHHSQISQIKMILQAMISKSSISLEKLSLKRT